MGIVGNYHGSTAQRVQMTSEGKKIFACNKVSTTNNSITETLVQFCLNTGYNFTNVTQKQLKNNFARQYNLKKYNFKHFAQSYDGSHKLTKCQSII